MWIKRDEEEPELYRVSADRYLPDIIPIREGMVTAIGCRMVSSKLKMCHYITTESNPLCIIYMVFLWIKENDQEPDQFLSFPFFVLDAEVNATSPFGILYPHCGVCSPCVYD